MSAALPMFHAVTGCDTVSSFFGIGKKTAFQTWGAFPAVTDSFIAAANGEIGESMENFEKFVVAMYQW